MYGRMAETATEYMKKGQMVYVEGRLNTREWEDQNQIKRRTTEIRCDNFTMLGKRSDSSGPPSSTPDSSMKPDSGVDDDLHLKKYSDIHKHSYPYMENIRLPKSIKPRPYWVQYIYQLILFSFWQCLLVR